MELDKLQVACLRMHALYLPVSSAAISGALFDAGPIPRNSGNSCALMHTSYVLTSTLWPALWLTGDSVNPSASFLICSGGIS